MYKIEKTVKVQVIRKLTLDYSSILQLTHCQQMTITVFCKAEKLNAYGMVFDPIIIEGTVKKKLDNKNLNDIIKGNPTLEQVADYVQGLIPLCYRVRVDDGDGNIAEYEK